MAERFGEMFKRLRIANGLTLRAFCQRHGLDPGNTSKLERGRMPPPDSEEQLQSYAKWLGLRQGTPEWQAFIDCASTERGRVPKDLLDDEELVDKLPVLFRMIRGIKANDQSLDELIEKIRKA